MTPRSPDPGRCRRFTAPACSWPTACGCGAVTAWSSRATLRLAVNGFDALDAPAWGQRARQELRAAGEVSGSRPREAWYELSPQELQIAQLAAEGLSNRDIGQRLYLSHRTVGSHLYRAYPKLGISSSRSQLNAACRSEHRPMRRSD